MVESKQQPKQKKANVKAPQPSAHGMYHYMSRAWRKPTEADILDTRKKMIEWRAGERITKLEHPTRIDRARNLGYKAKKGFLVFRVVVGRGGRAKARPTTKRRSKRFSVMKILRMNYRWVAEQRVQRAYRNLEVLNSYLIGKDGQHYFFEVIAIDREAPEIKNDANFSWINSLANKFRVLRGTTSSGKKSRGMRTKSRNLKVRPSLRSWERRGR